MTERPSQGEQIAGIAGLALILTMFLFAWFGFDLPAGAPHVDGLDAFDAFSDWFNIILVFAGVGGMMLALFGNGVARLPVALSVVTTVLAGLSVIILLIYIISPPGFDNTLGESVDLSREFGVWLGLIELIALTFGGYMAMQEEGVSFGGAADRLSGPGGGWQDQATQQQPQPPHHQPPPPPPQPYQQPPPPPPAQAPPPEYQQPPPPPPPPQPPAPPAHQPPPPQDPYQQPPPPPPA